MKLIRALVFACGLASVAASSASAEELITLSIPLRVRSMTPDVKQVNVMCLIQGTGFSASAWSPWRQIDANGDYEGYMPATFDSSLFTAAGAAKLHDGHARYNCHLGFVFADGKVGYAQSEHGTNSPQATQNMAGSNVTSIVNIPIP